MRDVYDFAKWFIKNGADSVPNTYDGNMKLQKLLALANLASIAEYGEPLFDEPILAFENGCVVEKVRLRYKNDYKNFKNDSEKFEPDFSEREYSILNFAMNVFGKASARELSEINHEFSFWKQAYKNGMRNDGYHVKTDSVVNMTVYAEDIKRMREIINAYKIGENKAVHSETINGITFFMTIWN